MRVARIFFVVVPVFLCLLLHVQSVSAAQQRNGLIVKLKSNLSRAEQAKVFAAHGGTRKARLQRLKLDVVNLAPGELEKAITRFKADPRVESVEIDHLRSAAGIPSDSSYASQWALPKIGWEQVFGVTAPTGTATVAILDAGIDATHPDLAGKVVAGTSILDGSDGRTDASGHGTMLAGIIAAAADNGAGIAGVAPAGVKVMPVTVLDAAGTGLDSNIIAGIVWAADHGADVILMPFSNPTFSQALQDAIDYAWSKGAVLIAATGNGGSTDPTFPAGDRGVVGVSATTQNDTVYSGANQGPDTFVVAPGVAIYSTTRGGGYGDITGTSASAAVVAGIASYMKAVDPTLSNGLIVSRLGQSADQNEGMTLPGYGLVNLADALNSVNMTPLQPAGVGTVEPYQDPYQAAGICDKLRFRTDPITTSVGQVTGPIQVAAHNGNFNCTLPDANNVLDLSSNSADYKFYLFDGGVYTEITRVTLIPKKDLLSNTIHEATFYYRDMNAGSPSITASLSTLSVPSVSQTQTVNPATQTIAFTSPAPASAVVDGPSYVPAATGGASGNPVVFTVDPASSSVCTVSSGVVSFKAVGTCVINANQAGNANYLAAPQVQQSFTVGKGNQAAVTLTVTPSTITYGNTGALSASGGSGSGGFSFSAGSSTGCSVSGTTLNVTNASGTCSVTATRATDTNYLAATSEPAQVTLLKAAQATVNVTAPASASYGETGQVITGSGGSGTGVFSYSAGDSTACSVDSVSGALTIVSATGSCSVSATRVADDNFAPASSLPKTINLVKAPQSAVTVSVPSSAYYGEGGVYATASGGSGSGSYSYAAEGTACQVNSSTGLLTITAGSGTCSVSATRAGDNDYTAATSAAAPVTITRASQAPLNAVITPSSLTYGSSAALSTVGGSGDGAVTFSASGSGCQVVNGTTLSVTNASGVCSVTATKAADGNYQAATSAPVQPTLIKAAQTAVLVTAPASARYGETGLSAVASGGSSSANYTYSATGACSIDASTGELSFGSAPGSCDVTATKPADDNYTAATSAAATINVNKALQPAITAVVTPSTVAFGGTAALSISGGAGDGGVSFTATGTGCEVSGFTLSVMNASASCLVTATKAADELHEAATSLATSVTLVKTTQAPVTVSAPETVVYRQSGASVIASGGSGDGSYSYSASGACTVNPTSGALSFNSGIGTCSVTATRSADDNYTASVSPAATITVNKAPQTTLTAVATPSTVSYGSTALLSISGGDGGGLVTFSADGTGCQVSGSTLSVTNASGSCSVTASKAGDANYEAATSLAVSVTLTKADQETVSVSAPASAHYGETGLSATANGGSSSVSYVYSATGACSIDASSGALTFSNATGSCSVTATKPADDNFNAATSAVATINVNKAAQPTLTLTVNPSTVVFGSTAAVATSGGAGDGGVSYEVTGTGCRIVGTTLEVLNASAGCSVTATKASDANYEAATSQAVPVALNKALQSTVSVSVPASAVYGESGRSAAASGGSGSGNFSYSASGACTVNPTSGALSFNATGTCSVTATKAADNNYSEASSTAATFSVAKASQSTLTAIVTPSTVSFGNTAALGTSGGNGGGLVSFSATGTGCRVSGTTLEVLNASGTCSITASKAADGNYEASSSLAVSVTLTRADQTTVSVSAPASAHFGQTGLSATATGGSSSASYVYAATGACSIDASSGALTFSNATGTCSITVTKPEDDNYKVATSAAAVINVNKAAQAGLSLTVAPSTLSYGNSATLSTTGGSGEGEVSYLVTGNGCQVSGSTLSVTNASGSCSVTATKATDLNYEPATSNTVTVTLQLASQKDFAISAPGTGYFGQSGLSAGVSGGSGGGGVSYSATGSSACSVHQTSGAISITSGSGNCVITATKAADSNYSAATSEATVTVTQAAQTPLTAVVTPGAVPFGTTASLTISGGSGGGAVTFRADGTGCSVSGSTLSVTSAGGSCSVTATKQGDLNYLVATSAPATVSLSKGTQQSVQVSAPLSAVIGEGGLFARASGGSGTGDYRYDGTGSTACSVNPADGALTINASFGVCSITAIRVGDANWNDSARSTAAIVSVGKADQEPLAVVVAPHPVPFGVTAALSTTGGSGNGAVSFSSTGSGCLVSGTSLTVNAAGGACSVTAVKASDDQYQAAASAPYSATLVKGNQAPVTVTLPETARYQQSGLFATASGGSAGAFSYSASGSCSVNSASGALAINAPSGSCTVTATRAGDSNYLPATASATLTAAKGAQSALIATATPATVPFGSSATLAASGGDGSGGVTFDAGVSTGCKVTGTSLSVTDAGGSCSVIATKAGDTNWDPVSSQALTVPLAKGAQTAVTVIAPATARLYQSGITVTAQGGSSSGSYSYSAGSSDACSVDPATGALSITAPTGSCSITATRAGDRNYDDATSTAVNITVNRALQTAVVAVATPSAVSYGNTALLTITGGSGTGSISFSAGSSSGCRVNDGATLVVDNASGSCQITATKLGDSEYDDATSTAITVTLVKAAQAAVTVSAPVSASYNEQNLAATASGGSGTGAYIYSAGASNACQVDPSSGALSITSGTGTCVITATKGTDQNYLASAASAPASVTINKAQQNMLAVSAPATLAFGSTAKLTVVGGSTGGPVSYSAGDSTGCRVTADVLSVANAAGTCFVTATRASDPNYNATTSAPVEVKLEKGAQRVVTVTAPATAGYAQSGVVALASGGDGTGSYSYSAGASTACSVDAATGAVTISAASGSCAITAVRGGDVNYLASAESAAATIAVSKGNQPALTAIVTPATMAYGSSARLSTSGGGGSGAVTFTLGAQSSGCEIDGTTLTVTDPAGSCSVTASKAADDYYNAATSTVSVPLVKGTQSAVVVSASAPSASYGESGVTVSASGGNGSGAYSYSASGSTACQVDASGNVSITSGTGSCVISATRAGDANYFPSMASVGAVIAVNKAQQSLSFAPLEGKTYGAADFSVTAAASSGLPVTFTSDNSAVAVISSQGVIKVTGQGSAIVTASQPGDLNYAPAEAVQQTLNVERALLTVKANDATRAYGAADPVFSATFSGFVNGENEAVLSGTPEFSTNADLSSNVGSYRLIPALGSLKADNYRFTFQEGILAVGLANQTITFNPLQPKSYGAASFDLEFTPGASGNSVLFTSSDESVATVSGRSVTIKKAGSTQIIASQAGSGNYAEATAQQTLTVNKAQLTVAADNKERPYNSANPDFTYKVSGFVYDDDASVVTGAPLFNTGAGLSSPVGSYTITITEGTLKATNYNFTMVNGVLAVGKASQNIVFEQLPSKTYGDSSFALTAQGGASMNQVTFTSSNTQIATISGNSVTIVGAGSVTITANQNGNANYAPASAQQTLEVAKARLTVKANDATRRYKGPNPDFSVSYDGFVRNDTATTTGVLAGAPSFTTDAQPDSIPGSYLITPSLGNLYSTKYDFSYQNGTLTVTRGVQDKVTVAAPASASYLQAGVSVTATGGSGTGSYSYQTISSSACSVDPATGALQITRGSGSCSVSATRAEDTLYEASAASAPVTITITRANQAAVTVNAPQTLSYGSSATLTGSGGSGSGGISFSAGSSTGCQVTGDLLSVTNAAGSCSVSAVKAADANYLAATSAPATVTLQRAGQSPVTVTLPARASYGQQGVIAVGSGGSGTGAFSYSAGSSTACSVNSSTGAVTIISAKGSCAITATRGGDNNHNASAASQPASLAIDRANQALITVAAPSSLVYGNKANLSASGGSGSGTVTFSAGSSTGCAVSGTMLSVIDATGSCSVSATRGADDNYNAATSAAATVNLAKATPVISWSNPKSIIFGTLLSARELNATANLEGGTFVYSPPAGTVLLIGAGQKLSVTYTPSDTRNYSTATHAVYLTVESATKPVPVDGAPTGSYANMKSGKNFQVTRTQLGTGSVTGVGSTSDTTFTDTTDDLKPNTIYQYTVASDTDPTQTVFMTVRTPLARGWNIVAVPYDTSGTPAAAFFADRVSSLYQWAPTGAPTDDSSKHSGSYVTANSLVPGMGYFVRTFSNKTMLTYSGKPGPESATVTLRPGWTMIANPALDSKVNIGERWLVDDVPLSFFINSGKIGGSIYWWNGTTYESWSIMQNNPQIEPWKGYWILNLDTVDHSLTIK